MSNSCRTLEITVISAENLTINDKPIKNKAFANIRTGDDHTHSSKSYSTRIDERGGQSPSWNEKLRVDLPSRSRDVVVEVHRRRSSRDRIVGRARIPTSDFIWGYSSVPPNHLHFLSYRLRDANGAKNGIINFSVRLTSPATTSEAENVETTADRQLCGGSCSGGTVTGIPLWYANGCKS